MEVAVPWDFDILNKKPVHEKRPSRYGKGKKLGKKRVEKNLGNLFYGTSGT